MVVCGGGNAGVQAALAAAQEGAKVAVLEIQPEASWVQLGNDICAFNAQWLVEKGYGPYKVGDIVAEFIRRGGGRVSAEIIRKFVANSGDMLDNIIAQIPETSNLFDLETGQAQIQVAYNMPDGSYYPFERGGFKSWATTIQNLSTKNPTPVCGREDVSRMTEIALYCKDAAEKLGAEYFFETDVTVLEQNDAGDVTGVIAKGPDGYVRYNAAKGVILATGDFGANPDMVVNLCTDINEQSLRCDIPREEMTGESNNKGTGHKLGCWAGGFIEQAPRPCMNTNGGNAGPWGTTPFLWLNDYGKRFMNEAMTPYIKPTTLKQPRGILATICDSKYLDVMKQCSTDHFSPTGAQRASTSSRSWIVWKSRCSLPSGKERKASASTACTSSNTTTRCPTRCTLPIPSTSCWITWATRAMPRRKRSPLSSTTTRCAMLAKTPTSARTACS